MTDTLYVSDLDGTLLGADSLVSARSRELLGQAISAGARFSLATARTPATVAGLLRGIDTPLPLVVMTGATLWDKRTGQYSHTRYIPESEARKVVDIYRRSGFSSFVYTLSEGMIHIYHVGAMSPQESAFMQERLASPFKRFHIPTDGESKLPERLDKVVLFYGMRPDALAVPVHDEVARTVDCSPLCYHDIYGPEIAVAEVFARESTKANGVRQLAREAGAKRIVAFGDNINDLPMLRAADVAVAVANAVDEVKQVADIVIGPNTADAVPEFILSDLRRRN